MGAVAQLGERRVRNAKVGGSNPLGSTKNLGERHGSGVCAIPSSPLLIILYFSPAKTPSSYAKILYNLY